MLPKWRKQSFFVLVTEEGSPVPGTGCRDAPPRPCLRGEAIGVLRDAAQKGHLIQPVGEGNPEGFLEETVDTMAKSPRITGRWAGREGEAPGDRKYRIRKRGLAQHGGPQVVQNLPGCGQSPLGRLTKPAGAAGTGLGIRCC